MSTLSLKRKKFFADYYDKWIATYKENVVRDVTYTKYLTTAKWVRTLAGTLRMEQLDRAAMQKLINRYAETHERQTVKDFSRQLHPAIVDAVDDGILKRNPMIRLVIPAGKIQVKHKQKWLEKDELERLIKVLDLHGSEPTWDKFIFLLAKTGLRFAEACALTPADFDLDNLMLSVNKSWNHRDPKGGFIPTKNPSSIRNISIDYRTARVFDRVIENLPEDKAIFVQKRVFNSTVNERLKGLCKKAGVPAISCHGLRHTHASVLIASGIPIMVVSKRLGHSNVTTTQEIYTHLLKDTEQRADEKISALMAAIG